MKSNISSSEEKRLLPVIARAFCEAIPCAKIALEKTLAMTGRSHFSSLEDRFDFIR